MCLNLSLALSTIQFRINDIATCRQDEMKALLVDRQTVAKTFNTLQILKTFRLKLSTHTRSSNYQRFRRLYLLIIVTR